MARTVLGPDSRVYTRTTDADTNGVDGALPGLAASGSDVTDWPQTDLHGRTRGAARVPPKPFLPLAREYDRNDSKLEYTMQWFSPMFSARHSSHRRFVPRQGRFHRATTGLVVAAIVSGAIGCAAPLINPNQPASESAVLSDVRQLTRGFGRVGDGAFSPDVRWVVFQASVAGEAYDQLFVAPLQRDGEAITGIGRPIRISPKGSANAGAAISPNGRSIVLASTGPRAVTAAPVTESAAFATDADPALNAEPTTAPTSSPTTTFAVAAPPVTIPETRLYRADNWESAVNSAAGGAGAVDLTRYPIPGDLARAAHPAWSPDGGSIAFAGQESADGDVELYVARPDGSARIRVTSERGPDVFPSFSTDGQQLLFTRPAGPDIRKVELAAGAGAGAGGAAVAPVTAGKQWTIVTGATDARRAAWVPPDGRRLVYASKLAGQPVPRLRVIRADGRLRTDMTITGPGDTAPTVSSDGRHILWTSRRSTDGTPQLFVARFTLPPGV